jgi:glycosyltransferase involved in cell wall biosynthesis
LNGAGLETMSHTFLATLHTLFTNSADIVCFQGMGNALFIPLLKLGGKRTVVFMDGIDWERPKWGFVARTLLKLGASSAYRWGDAITVDNISSQQRFAEIYGRQPQFLPLGADLWETPGDDIVRELGLTSNNYILFVGMLRPDKGVHMLVDAYTQLDTDVPLVIVGDTFDQHEYKQSLIDAADDRVHFLGYRYGEEVKQLFANCLIYVQPSIMEGNSPALMSAMACGRCVVVNGIEQNRETIGDAGIAFAEGDVDDLRAKLAQLLSDRAMLDTFGAQAKQRIIDNYSWDRTVDRLQVILEAVEQ